MTHEDVLGAFDEENGRKYAILSPGKVYRNRAGCPFLCVKADTIHNRFVIPGSGYRVETGPVTLFSDGETVDFSVLIKPKYGTNKPHNHKTEVLTDGMEG